MCFRKKPAPCIYGPPQGDWVKPADTSKTTLPENQASDNQASTGQEDNASDESR